MAAAIYTLCALTAFACAVLLLRGWRASRSVMLFWCGLCFVGLTINNVVVVLDELVLPLRDLSPWRLSIGLVSVSLLLYGLIFEER